MYTHIYKTYMKCFEYHVMWSYRSSLYKNMKKRVSEIWSNIHNTKSLKIMYIVPQNI